jgi:hypothetical protein
MAYTALFVLIITPFLGDQLKEDPMDRASRICRCGDIYRKIWVEETAFKI